MSEKEKIKKIYQKKIQSLIKLNKAYFQKDNPIIADSEYDELKKELSSYIEKYPYLKQIKNLDTIVGSKPSKKFKKIKHTKPMLSLSNAFEKNDMIDFKKKFKKFLNVPTELELT